MRHHFPHVIVAACAAALSSAACDSAPESADSSSGDSRTVEVLDSAGVTVAFSPGSAELDTVWRVDSVAAVRIGSVHDGPQALANVRDVAVGPGGEIVVANAGTHEIRAFSPVGDFLWSGGREGSGPGEYQNFRGVEYCGDTVFVADLFARRITLLAGDGSVIATRPWQPLRTGSAPSSFSCHSSGTLALLDRGSPASPPPGPHTVAAVIGTVAPGDSAAAVLVESPGFDRYRHPTMDGPADFGMSTFVAAGEREVHVAVGDRAEVRTFDLTGALRRVARWEQAPQRLTEELAARERDRGASVLPAALRSEYRTTWETLERPDRLPLISRMIGATDGDLWVREYRLDSATTEDEVWRVLAPDGALRGIATVPPGFELRRLFGDQVIGLTRDEMGVEYVEVRRVDRGR